jgi:hypothetical protein
LATTRDLHVYLAKACLREFTVDEELPAASRGDLGEPGTDEGEGDGEVDAQALLSAASRAIAAVRRQAAGLLRHRSDPPNDDEAPVEEPPV